MSDSRLLKAEASVLLVVDVQARLAPAIPNRSAILRNVEVLARASSRLGVPVLASEHNPRGLGATVAELDPVIPLEARFEKITFSCLGAAEIRDRLSTLGRPQVVVAGCEAHVCVMQSAISLAEAGYRTYIVADATGSRDPANAEAALARMTRAGVEAVTTEMAVFEWLERADRPEFKDLLQLVK
ncbi:MAG: hydrolase [Kiloniellales bacterium]|nr:hydrolase [Kiloniellales bacterium]